MANLLQANKKILYKLKRNYGQPASFFIPTENDYDITTGEISMIEFEVKVNRVIVLPTDIVRSFVYDLSFIASNKNFTYGGYFDKNTRNIIVQKKDLQGQIPALNWECAFKDKRYTIKNIIESEDGAGFVMSMQTIDHQDDNI